MSVAEHIPKRYTYADLKTWPEGERWELIDGVPHCLSGECPRSGDRRWCSARYASGH